MKRAIILFVIAMLCLPSVGYSFSSQHSDSSFYQAVGNKFGGLDKYFRNNFLYDVSYSNELVGRFKSWLENDEQRHFEVDSFLNDRQFVLALQNIAGEYAKKEWWFRNSKRIQDINGVKSSSTQHEQVPFSKTDRYFTRRFIVPWPNAKPNGRYPGYSYYRMYLLAGDEFSAADPRYPLHQAGGFSVALRLQH